MRFIRHLVNRYAAICPQMKTLLCWLLGGLLLCCSQPGLAAQHQSGVGEDHAPVRIGIFPFEPINFLDENGQARGFYPALLEKIASLEGWDLVYVAGSWAECLERLQTHDIDLMISVAYSADRAKIMDYTHESALELWGQVFVKPESKGVNISDLAGQNVAVMRNDISGKNFIKTAKELNVSFTTHEYPGFADVFNAVKNGVVVAAVAPQHFGLRHGHEYGLVPSSIQFSPFSIYFTAKKGHHHNFLSVIDAYLFRWKQEKGSYYYQQLAHWLGGGEVERIPGWFFPTLFLVAGIVLSLFFLSLFFLSQLFKAQVRKVTAGLAQSEAELSAIYHGAPELMFLVNTDHRVCKVNQATLDFTGRCEEEIIGMRGGEMFNCIHAHADPKGCGFGVECQNCLLRSVVMDTFSTENLLQNKEETLTVMQDSGVRQFHLLISTTLLRHGKEAQVLVCAEDITEIKEAQLALIESEERFRAVVEQAGDAIFLMDERGRFISVNQQASNSLGYSIEELQTMSVADIAVGFSAKEARRILSTIRETGEKRDVAGVGRCGDGSLLNVEISIGPLQLRDKKLFLAIVRDVTVRKKIEETLYFTSQKNWFSREEKGFTSLVEFLSEALDIEYALVGRLIDQGQRVRTIGFCAKGVLVKDIEYDLEHTPCGSVIGKDMCLVSSGVRETFPKNLLLDEMQVESYAGVPLWGSAGKAIGLVAVFGEKPIKNMALVESVIQLVAVRCAHELERLDFVEQLRQNQRYLEERTIELQEKNRALQTSEQRHASLFHQFETLLDAISDPLALLTSGMKTVWTNEAYDKVSSELACGPTRGLTLFQLDTGEGESAILRCLKSGRVVEDVMNTPDRRKWGVKVFPLLDNSQQINQVIAIAVDITEKVRLREESNRSSRLASLGELAAGIAHEINNPNAVILLNTPIIKDAFADAEAILGDFFREHGQLTLAGIDFERMQVELPVLIDRVQESAGRIKRIVEDLKNFVRDEGPKEMEAVDMNLVAEVAVRLLNNSIKKATHNFQISLAENLPTVKGDFQKLEQVVVNLVQNACQSLTDANQEICLETNHDKANNSVIVRVRDQGRGIAPEDLPKISDPFFTTKRTNGGTGLGLSVTERILREHNGQLAVESVPGRGAEFRVSLPTWNKEI